MIESCLEILRWYQRTIKESDAGSFAVNAGRREERNAPRAIFNSSAFVHALQFSESKSMVFVLFE